MSYTKQNFEPGQVLTAAKLNLMDDQIATNELTTFTGQINSSVAGAPTFTCSATYEQIAAVWPNCILKFTGVGGGSTNYYYARPGYLTTARASFYNTVGVTNRIIYVEGSTWAVDIKNEAVPGYIGKIVVLGDDMCAGNDSWVKQLTTTYDNKYTSKNTVYNAAAVGACFGNYSLGSATSINAQAQAQSENIKKADMVIICSCYNDVKAAEANNDTTYSTVLTAVRNAITTVKGYINGDGGNPKCRIVYVSYGDGYVADGNNKNYAWANNLAPTDAAIKCVCQEQGIQVIDLMSGSGCNGSDFTGSFPIPSTAGAVKIGRAMVQKLIDRSSTIKPPSSLIIDYGLSNAINPHRYNFNFLQWLYVNQGIDIVVMVDVVVSGDASGQKRPGRLLYMSTSTSSTTASDRLAVWLIEKPSNLAGNVSSNTYLNRALIQSYVSGGTTVSSYTDIYRY